MKIYQKIFLSILIISCTSISEREKRINKTEEIVLKVYNAQLTGDTETFKSMLSNDFTFTLRANNCPLHKLTFSIYNNPDNSGEILLWLPSFEFPL